MNGMVMATGHCNYCNAGLCEGCTSSHICEEGQQAIQQAFDQEMEWNRNQEPALMTHEAEIRDPYYSDQDDDEEGLEDPTSLRRYLWPDGTPLDPEQPDAEAPNAVPAVDLIAEMQADSAFAAFARAPVSPSSGDDAPTDMEASDSEATEETPPVPSSSRLGRRDFDASGG